MSTQEVGIREVTRHSGVLEAFSAVDYQELHDRQDDHEHDQAVHPHPGSLVTRRAATYAPAALPRASEMPADQFTSLLSAKTKRICRPTTSRMNAFMALPCLRS
jgi:hypothetical protein